MAIVHIDLTDRENDCLMTIARETGKSQDEVLANFSSQTDAPCFRVPAECGKIVQIYLLLRSFDANGIDYKIWLSDFYWIQML